MYKEGTEVTMSDYLTRAVNLIPKRCTEAMQSEIGASVIEEIRMRAGRPLEVVCSDKVISFPLTVTQTDISDVLSNATEHSLYAYENQIRSGYITISGGHRIGLSGRVFVQEQNICKIDEFSSINMRIAREIKGACKKILPYIIINGEICSCIIVSEPGKGKTTLLRDICRAIGDGEGIPHAYKVSLIDERGELASSFCGIAQLDIGNRTDVFDNCPKSAGMMLALRSMSPEVIIIDEIGTKEDMAAIKTVACCGVKVISSAHASSMEELKRRVDLTENCFERFIFIDRAKEGIYIKNIYDSACTPICP